MHSLNRATPVAPLTLSPAPLVWHRLLSHDHQLTPDRIRGCLLGIAVGDALGLPVETLTPAEILSRYGRITSYVTNPDHKWYGKSLPGTWSDDTQLTLAVTEALSEGGFSLTALRESHLRAAKETTLGWGNTTRAAVERFGSDQSSPRALGPGTGNGVIMKLAPFAMWLRAHGSAETITAQLDAFTDLTHPTPLARCATRALAAGHLHLAATRPSEFEPHTFVEAIVYAAESGQHDQTSTELVRRIRLLSSHASLPLSQTVEQWGGGSCYVLDSLPVSLLCFLKNPSSFEAVINAVNLGGDSDSNGSIVGALLGVLNGSEIIPSGLVRDLQQLCRIERAAAQAVDLVLS
jgi:ADP-ribosyl-[dinitrogen reductase] hydrolase